MSLEGYLQKRAFGGVLWYLSQALATRRFTWSSIRLQSVCSVYIQWNDKFIDWRSLNASDVCRGCKLSE